MDFRRLFYFVAAAEEQNFRRAAERLHVAQPALSRQIASLEAELGFALFERDRRRVRLTSAGRYYLEQVRRVLSDLDRVAAYARGVSAGVQGTLRVGFHESAGRTPQVSHTFHAYRAAYPQVALQLSQRTSQQQFDALRKGELDAGFVHWNAQETTLQHLTVATDRECLAVHRGHRLSRKKRVTLAMLQDEPFIWLDRQTNAAYVDGLLAACRAGGLYPRIVQEAQGEAMSLNLVAAGMGVSFVVTSTGRSWVPGIVFLEVDDMPVRMTLALAWRSDASAPLVEGFVELVRNTLSDSKAVAS